MKRKSDYTIFVAQTDAAQAQLLRCVIASHGLSVHVLDPRQRFEPQIEMLCHGRHAESVLVADLSTSASQGCAPDEMLSRLSDRLPHLRLVTTLSDRLTVTAQEVKWAMSLGATGLFPCMSALRIEETLLPVLAAVVGDPRAKFDTERIADMIRALGSDVYAPPSIAAAQKLLSLRGTGSADIGALIAAIRGADGFDVKDRSFRLTTYPNCFVGREAVDVLTRITGRSRETSLAIGRLLRLIGAFHHVTGEHDFEDGNYFYRFSASTQKISSLDLRRVVQAARGATGFDVQDRHYLGTRYAKCFVGSEATDWLKNRYDLTSPGAVALGQSLLRLHVIRHVVDEHDFAGGGLFYRFT